MNLLVTGGCGFIGSNFIRSLISKDFNILNIDKLTYAGNLNNLKDLSNNEQTSLYEKSLINFIFSKLEKKEKKIKEEIEFLNSSHELCFQSNYNYNTQSKFYYSKIISSHYNKIKYEGQSKTNIDFRNLQPLFIIGLPW